MTDHVAAHELKLFIDNDYQLYSGQRQSIMDNLLRKKNAGTYDHAKAKKLWGYLAESGAKKYAKEFASPREWNTIFTAATRRQTAEELADDFEAEWRLGNYSDQQEALKTKAQRKASGGGGRAAMMAAMSRADEKLAGYKAAARKPAARKPTRKRASTCSSGGTCTKAEVEKMFKTAVMPTILESEDGGYADRPLRREAWNNWIDGLERDGTITEKQASSWGHPKWLETYKAGRRR